MVQAVTEKLEPQAFFHWFEEISKIPHGSGKEQKLVEYIWNYAQDRGIAVESDALGNLFMKLPATAGYEGEPPVLFQAHMDMVWAKAPEVEFDFETQPLRLCIEGDRLHAQGTTLGADNAVGMATMLALGDAKDIPHPPLEFLFTVQEETGMHGARGFDMGKIMARRMINMDCGDSHVLGVSSMGRVSAKVEKEYAQVPVPQGWCSMEISIGGGTGGHSGLDIHRGRCCAGNAMGALLRALDPVPLMLVSMEAQGSILRSCRALAAIPADLLEDAKGRMEVAFARLREVHQETDPDLFLRLEPKGPMGTALGLRETAVLIQMLTELRSTRFLADPKDPEITILSGTIGSICLGDGAWKLEYGFRATRDEEMEKQVNHYTQMLARWDLELRCTDSYPGWPEQGDSPFRGVFQRLHQKLYGRPMELERVPGGIEVGIIMAAIPEMDPVGIAPTSRGAHTSGEYLAISQVADYWDLLKAVLADRK